MSEEITGVLTSQIGYEAGGPKRVVLRSTDRARFADAHAFALTGDGGATAHAGTCDYWGERWGSHWWVGRFDAVTTAGTYRLDLSPPAGPAPAPDPVVVERGVLWGETFRWACLHQLEVRATLAKAKVGWMDAGMPWQESNAQSAAVLALCDVLEHADGKLGDDDRRRVAAQVRNGHAYAAMLQDEAARRGLPAGAVSHQIPDFETEATAGDATKAACAWARSARLLPGITPDERADYRRRGVAALRFAVVHPPPPGENFNRKQRGLPESYTPPAGQHATRDLLMAAAAAFELSTSDDPAAGEMLDLAVQLVDEAMERQETENPLHGLSGFFYEFADRHHPEPAWAHQIQGRPLGVDAGASVPHGVGPVLDLLRRHPGHPRAGRWADALRAFAHDYLLPACRSNPFGLLPLQLTRDHGLIDFAGPWHGMTCIYGHAAALALDLADHFADDAFREIAVGNLQWVAGLNAGLTRASLDGCVVYAADVPEGAALPVSLMHGVGGRSAGCWLNLRGAVCNGFSVGRQFRFDTDVTRANDGPHSLTDEDWLPHAAAWLGAVARL